VAQLNLAFILLRERNNVQRAISLWESVGQAGHPTGYTEIGIHIEMIICYYYYITNQ
jgi:hypothetical protein